MKLIFKIREPDSERIGLLDLLDYIGQISHSATNIANLRKRAKLTILKDVLKETNERVIIKKINKEISTRELKRKYGITIIAVERNNLMLFPWSRNINLKKGDKIIFIGDSFDENVFDEINKR